jgi:hypothetical protein
MHKNGVYTTVEHISAFLSSRLTFYDRRVIVVYSYQEGRFHRTVCQPYHTVDSDPVIRNVLEYFGAASTVAFVTAELA